MTTRRHHEEKRLFKRLVSAYWDLTHARCCASQILDRQLHESETEDDRHLLRCLNTALIASYWRPFSENKDTIDELGSLPGGFRRIYSSKERSRHQRVRKARHSEHAHSDADAHSTQVSVRQVGGMRLAIPIGRDVFVPLPLKDVVELRGMIDKLLARIAEERMRIQRNLETDTSF